MADEVKKRLEFICTNMVAADNQSYFLGKEATTKIANTYFIPSIVSYDGFKTKWLPTLTSATATAALGEIYYTTTGTTWALANTISNDNAFNYSSIGTKFDFNFTNALKAGGNMTKTISDALNTVSTSSTELFATLLDLLDTIRVTYNALEDTQFKKLKADDTTMVVNKYSASFASGAITYQTVVGSALVTPYINKLLPNLQRLDNTSSNLLAIRRVLLGYECMIHAYLAMHLFTGNTENKVKYLANATIYKLIALNDKTYDNSSGIGNIQTNLTTRVASYNNNRQRIEEVDKNLSDIKLDIGVENNKVLSKSHLLQKNTYSYYVFLSVFIVLLLVLVFAQQQADRPTLQTKWMVGLVMIGSVVALFVMYFINHSYLQEAFALPNTTETTSDKIIPIYNGILLETFDQYLSNTIYISLLLGTYRRYGDISHAMNKEFYYYDNLTTQLKQSKEKLNSTQVQDYRMSMILQYRVYLFLQILVIVSLGVFISLYTGTSYVTFVLMIFLSLCMVYMYILNTNNLVHTDATKLYWNQPNPAMLY